MTDDTRRQLKILATLMRAGRPMTVREIRSSLPAAYRTHVRSIQRDLVALKRWMPVSVDKAEKPFRWYARPDALCPCCGR